MSMNHLNDIWNIGLTSYIRRQMARRVCPGFPVEGYNGHYLIRRSIVITLALLGAVVVIFNLFVNGVAVLGIFGITPLVCFLLKRHDRRLYANHLINYHPGPGFVLVQKNIGLSLHKPADKNTADQEGES